MKEHHNTDNKFFSAEQENDTLEPFSAYLHSKNNSVKSLKMTIFLHDCVIRSLFRKAGWSGTGYFVSPILRAGNLEFRL